MKAYRNTGYSDAVEIAQITLTHHNKEMAGDLFGIPAEATCNDCAEILHGLNNVLAGMLLNAQVMEWKLPSYSRSKRYLHEIERNAQRGGELVRRLLRRLEAGCRTDLRDSQVCREASSMTGAGIAVATQEPDASVRVADEPMGTETHTAPVFLSPRKKVPHTMV